MPIKNSLIEICSRESSWIAHSPGFALNVGDAILTALRAADAP
jgi:hypothetical protein